MLVPTGAIAANLQCLANGPVGTLLNPDNFCPEQITLQNIFTALLCNYQTVLDEVLRRMYCGMQTYLLEPLSIALIIYIILFGIQFTIGYVRLSQGEVVMRLIKISLIWVFATNATYAIDLGYNFLINAADQGVAWVLELVMPPLPPDMDPNFQSKLIFLYMDYLIWERFMTPFTEDGVKLIGFVAMLSYLIPPIFMMFIGFFIKSITILIRALITYLLGISGIAFLMALSPVFCSFALFKPTTHLFNSWLRYLASFVMQIILTFAAVALWLLVITAMGQFFVDLANIIIPIEKILEKGVMRDDIQEWSICKNAQTVLINGFMPTLQCPDNPEAIAPSKLIQNIPLIYFIVVNLLSLIVIAYLFDALLIIIADVARQLAGPSYAPQLGGGQGIGMMRFPGMGRGFGFWGMDDTRMADFGGGVLDKAKAGILGAGGGGRGGAAPLPPGKGGGGGAPAVGPPEPVADANLNPVDKHKEAVGRGVGVRRYV